MKKKNILMVCMVCVCMLAAAILINSGKNGSTDYVDGRIEEGKSIGNYYTLKSGTTSEIAVTGRNNTVAVKAAETTDGGAVAWKSNKYSYSKTGSKESVAWHLASTYFGSQAIKKGDWGK